MEVIVITDNSEYSELIPDSKNLKSSSLDIFSIIQTEIFLNHHHHISLYFLKDNIPNQFQLPFKIATQLLDRAECEQIQLIINDKQSIILSAESDLMQIFSKIQISIQSQFGSTQKNEKQFQEQLKATLNQSGGLSNNVTKYCFKYWKICIDIYFTDILTSFNAFKKLVNETAINKSNSDLLLNEEGIIKLFLYINEDNYGQFMNWSDSDSQEVNHIYLDKSQLSNEYLTLKQEIENQKAVFRKKIKIVEAILGENINIEKLLCEEDGKEENMEFKRLKQTFQTIKNIDNVLIEQENDIKTKMEELKQKRKENSEELYRYAKQITKFTKDHLQLKKQIQVLQFKLTEIAKNKHEYIGNRSFEPSSQIKHKLEGQIKKMKSIYQAENSMKNKKVRNNQNETGEYIKKKNNNSVDMKGSMSSAGVYRHKNFQQIQEKYYSKLRNKSKIVANQFGSYSHSTKKKIFEKNNTKKQEQQIKRIGDLLIGLSFYMKHINEIMGQIEMRKANKMVKSKIQNCEIYDETKFPILSQLLSHKKSDIMAIIFGDNLKKNAGKDCQSQFNDQTQKQSETFIIRKTTKKTSIGFIK